MAPQLSQVQAFRAIYPQATLSDSHAWLLSHVPTNGNRSSVLAHCVPVSPPLTLVQASPGPRTLEAFTQTQGLAVDIPILHCEE